MVAMLTKQSQTISWLILILSFLKITLMAQLLATKVAPRMKMLAMAYVFEIPFTIWHDWIVKVKFDFPIAICICESSPTSASNGLSERTAKRFEWMKRATRKPPTKNVLKFPEYIINKLLVPLSCLNNEFGDA